jgi:hypothetical protein
VALLELFISRGEDFLCAFITDLCHEGAASEMKAISSFSEMKMSLTEYYECDKLNERQVTGPFFLLPFFKGSKLEGRKIIIGGEKPCVQG